MGREAAAFIHLRHVARLAPVGHGWERPVSDSEDRTGAASDLGSGGGEATSDSDGESSATRMRGHL